MARCASGWCGAARDLWCGGTRMGALHWETALPSRRAGPHMVSGQCLGAAHRNYRHGTPYAATDKPGQHPRDMEGRRVNLCTRGMLLVIYVIGTLLAQVRQRTVRRGHDAPALRCAVHQQEQHNQQRWQQRQRW